RHYSDQNTDHESKRPTVVYLFHNRHLDCKGYRRYQEPHDKDQPNILSACGDILFVLCVSRQHVSGVVAQSDKNRDQCAPAKPPQRSRHQLRYDLPFRRAIKRLHQIYIYQIEKVQMADPDDSSQKMETSEQYLNISHSIGRRMKNAVFEEECQLSLKQGQGQEKN